MSEKPTFIPKIDQRKGEKGENTFNDNNNIFQKGYE